MNRRSYLRLMMGTAAAVPASASIISAFAQSSPALLPRGRAIQAIIGSAIGGGNDLVARTTLQLLGEVLPGKPKFEIKDMAGGDGLAATNFLFNASPERLTLGFLGRAFPVAQLMQNPAAHFDARRFEWIGSLGDDDDILTVRADTGITSIDQLVKTTKPVRFGGALKSAMLYMMPECLRRDTKGNFESIAGAGTTAATVIQALERGEIQGIWEKYQSLVRSHPDWLKPGGFLNILARRGKLRDLPGVPFINDYLSERSKSIVALADLSWGNPCCVPPGTSPDLVALLRDAFEHAVADPRLRAMAEKQHAVVNPIHADELRAIVEATLSTPDEVVRDFKEIAGLV